MKAVMIQNPIFTLLVWKPTISDKQVGKFPLINNNNNNDDAAAADIRHHHHHYHHHDVLSL
jgi:hypothetical protein